MDWIELKETNTLEDFYNILLKNKPHHKNKLYKQWDYLESIVYEELLEEDEHPHECEKFIDEIIEFLKVQKKEELKRYER